MKITIISDTHNKLHEIEFEKDSDLLIHCGDFTIRGEIWEIEREFEKLKQLKKRFKHIVIIPGNHDISIENTPTSWQKYLKEYDIHLLINSHVTIEGINIYGSPYTPEFHNWAFQLRTDEQSKLCWDCIPDDTNILITHGPPKGLMDFVEITELGRMRNYINVGCSFLSKRIKELKELKLHCFGHIHDNYGQNKLLNINYINAALLDHKYNVKHKPIYFNYNKEKNIK